MDDCVAFCHLLKQAATTAEKQLSEALKGSDLSMPQAMMLLHLHEGVGSVSDLSERMCCSPGNVTQHTDALLKKKFVERYACKEDRRVQHLKLTKAGHAEMESMSEKLSKQAHLCLKSIPKDERIILERLLSQYVSA